MRPLAVPMETSADRRLGPYVLLAVAGTIAALVTGQAGFLAPAVAAAVRVLWGFGDRRALGVEVVGIDAPARVLDGDAWTLRLSFAWRGTARVDILHTGIRGSEIVGPAGWSLTAADGAVVELDAKAMGWGRHDLGRIEIRARRPRSMLRADGGLDLPGAVRVLPTGSRLDELLSPPRPRAAAGTHVAALRGSGTDFADLRPYVPGDRLRDVSWAASARGDQPWVVVRHPEHAGAVVLMLDSFTEVGAPPGALDRAARVVWSIAREHLAAGDRVGLVALGSALVWLHPVSGRRARWQVLDALLSVGGDLRGSRADDDARPPSTPPARLPLPSDAVIVGVSPLQSDAFVSSLLHEVRIGHPAVVIGVAPEELVPGAGGEQTERGDDAGAGTGSGSGTGPGSGAGMGSVDEVERAAIRLWRIEIETRRALLARAGVASTVVGDDGVRALRLLRNRRAA